MGNRARMHGFAALLSWLFLLGTPACVLGPYDGQAYNDKVPAISVHGYTGAPGDTVVFERFAPLANYPSGYREFWTLTAATTGQTIGGVTLYSFQGNIPIVDQHWERGFSGYKATFRARSEASTAILSSVEEDWYDCYLEDPNPSTFLQRCASPNSPWVTIYTADYEVLEECADCMCEVCSPVTSTCRTVVDTEFPACSAGGKDGVCFDGECVTSGSCLRPAVGRINCCSAEWCDSEGEFWATTCLDPLEEGVPCDPTGVEAPLETLNQAGHCVRTRSGGWTTSECVYNEGDPRSGVCGGVECSYSSLSECVVNYCDPDEGCRARFVPYRQGCHGVSTDEIGFCWQGLCYY
ncbi:MAG: hypothetical protein AAF500_02760 [Myxococcota bacterium]